MQLPVFLRLIGLWVALCISSSLATPLSLYSSVEGSADEEEFHTITSSLPPSSPSSPYQTTPAGPTHVDTDFLRGVVSFLKENMFLIIVAATFTLLVFFIICGAIFMSRRRKVNAYYPSSFPSKMYVDHRDKTGGAKPFKEVPDKPALEQEKEPVNSHEQLQADIMRAAKSLRTPNKSVDAAGGSEPSPKAADHSPEDSSKPDGTSSAEELPSFPEEKELSQLPVEDDAAAASTGGHEVDSSRQPEEGDSQEPVTGRSLRPSSLHIHNDSATLQLIAGEKTAF